MFNDTPFCSFWITTKPHPVHRYNTHTPDTDLRSDLPAAKSVYPQISTLMSSIDRLTTPTCSHSLLVSFKYLVIFLTILQSSVVRSWIWRVALFALYDTIHMYSIVQRAIQSKRPTRDWKNFIMQAWSFFSPWKICILSLGCCSHCCPQ